MIRQNAERPSKRSKVSLRAHKHPLHIDGAFKVENTVTIRRLKMKIDR